MAEAWREALLSRPTEDCKAEHHVLNSENAWKLSFCDDHDNDYDNDNEEDRKPRVMGAD